MTDPEKRLVTTTGHGIVTDEEFLHARRQLLEDPTFDSAYDRIWDFHAVTEVRVSEKVLAQLVSESPTSAKPICRAVVMSEQAGPMKTILDFIDRTRGANRRIAAFPDRPTAEKWVLSTRVNLPPE